MNATTIKRTFRFESAHRLPNVPDGHKCKRLHGHSYTASVSVSGEVDRLSGMIVDFYVIDRAWAKRCGQLDHNFLNEIPGLENPTSENLAAWIHGRMTHFGELFGLEMKVTVSETCTSACEYAPGPQRFKSKADEKRAWLEANGPSR